jgi:hypothetical protein
MNPLETLSAATGELGKRFHLHPQDIERYMSRRGWKVETGEGAVELGEDNSLRMHGQLMKLLLHNVVRLTEKRVCYHPGGRDLPATTPKYDFFHAILKPEYSATL